MDNESRITLLDIVDTPISPELIPADEQGNIKQKTEDLVGPYELHDFFLYQFLRFGFRPAKIFFLASIAFAIHTMRNIKKWLTIFCRRFFQQQLNVRACPMVRKWVPSLSVPEAIGVCQAMPVQLMAERMRRVINPFTGSFARLRICVNSKSHVLHASTK